jgi:hypothetical protein
VSRAVREDDERGEETNPCPLSIRVADRRAVLLGAADLGSTLPNLQREVVSHLRLPRTKRKRYCLTIWVKCPVVSL